jgi:hypothetical protein
MLKTMVLPAAIAAAVVTAVAPSVVALAKIQTVADARLRACIEEERRYGTICDEGGAPLVGQHTGVAHLAIRRIPPK